MTIDTTGRVRLLLRKMYEWVVERGERYPSQNNFARIVRVVLMVIGLEYFALSLVGSLPLVVYRMTVPSGQPSGRESVKEKIELFEVTLPGTLKMGSPRMSLQMVPQLVEDGVGVYWYPHTSLPSVSRPYEILGDGCLANLVNPSATVLLWKR